MRTQAKTSLAVIIVLLIIIGAITPWIDGMLFKAHYYHFIQALETDKRVKISVVEYRMGWFSSDAKISIMPTIDMMTGMSPPPNTPVTSGYTTPTIILDQHISHGPFVLNPITRQHGLGLATIESNMHLPSSVEAILLGNQANPNGIISIKTLATLGGDFLNQVSTPIFNISLPGVGSVVWQGINGTVNFHMEGQHIQNVKSNITIGAMTAQSSMGSFITKDSDVVSDMTLDKIGLWNGSYSLAAPEVTVTDQSDVYSVKNAYLLTTFGVTPGNLYTTQVQVLLGLLNTPHFAINQQSHLNMSFENLNAEALVNLINAGREDEGKTTISPQETERYLTLIPAVITTTTVIKQDSSIFSSWGRLIESGQATWPVAAKTMDDLSKNVHAKADIRISISLVNQLIEFAAQQEANRLPQTTATDPVASPAVPQTTPGTTTPTPPQTPTPVAPPVPKPVSTADTMKQHIADLIKQGYIKQDKDDYVTSFTYEQGVLKANGLVVKDLPQ